MTQTAETHATRPPLTPRTIDVDLSKVPNLWLADNPVATHVANGVNLLFPAGERFFVRSVHKFASRIKDPALAEQVKGFAGQEGRHARAHEDVFELLERQGYVIRPFLKVYEAIAFGILEKNMPPKLALAVTAAAEHFTAIMATSAFGEVDALKMAHEEMRKLLTWHAAEEIEHKAVAFDVLAEVAPGYPLRAAGMVAAAALLGAFWAAAAATLLAQETKRSGISAMFRSAKRFRAYGKEGKRRPIVKGVFLAGIARYLRPDFHPWQEDDRHLAARYFEGATYVRPAKARAQA